MQVGNNWTCRICNQKFKRKSATHLQKKHNMTTAEYDEKYDMESHYFREVIKFFNEFYITTRYRYVKYFSNGAATVDSRTDENVLSLNDSILKKHLQGTSLIAIYFPAHYTKLIGFDIDIKDFNIVKNIVKILESKGIKRKNILVSFSGGKGYHVDLFLDNIINKEIAQKFIDKIKSGLQLDEEKKKKVETRGTTDQAYKLPLGYKSVYSFCNIYDDKLIEIQENDTEKMLEVINTREKLDINIINQIVNVSEATKPLLNEQEVTDFEELQSEISALDIYKNTLDRRIKKIEKTILQGLSEDGNRNNTVFEIALYLKDYKQMCLADTKEYILTWINSKWTGKAIAMFRADKSEYKEVIRTVESAYNEKYRFTGANSIILSVLDVKEVVSMKTGNSLVDKALRRLYYILLLHSKAYAKEDGSFYMTYEQMILAGAINQREKLSNQLEKLEQLGKVIIVRKGERAEKGYKHKPNVYKLTNLFNYDVYNNSIFRVCDDEEKCKDCLEKAVCHLLSDKDRRKVIKGKDYKKLEKCPVNKD